MKYQKSENSFLFFVVIMPKYQVGSVVFILILTGLLNPLFSYFLLFVHNTVLLFFYLLLIGILLLRPYESIKTSDSY